MFLSRERKRRISGLSLDDRSSGYDAFGANRRWIELGLAAILPIYNAWFRVTSSGIANVPADGPVILVSNHGGALPFDAVMLWADVLLSTTPPRLARPVVEHFVRSMPAVSTFFTRGGCVGGARNDAEYLLDHGELLLIFPEGLSGMTKPRRERYRLQNWSVGFAELAIAKRAPVVPIAVIGAEEQYLQLGRLPAPRHIFGAPYLPLLSPPVPLPVHYQIYYGEPIELHREANGRDGRAAALAALKVKSTVETLIERGLEARRKGGS